MGQEGQEGRAGGRGFSGSRRRWTRGGSTVRHSPWILHWEESQRAFDFFFFAR